MATWPFALNGATASAAQNGWANILAGDNALNAVHTNANLLALMNNGAESAVNGAWVYILSQYFDFPAYVVCPEFRTREGNRGDGVVVPSNNPDAPVFGFEGKKSLGQGATLASANQITKYITAIASIYGHGFGVYAVGTAFRIVRHTKGTGVSDAVWTTAAGGGANSYWRIANDNNNADKMWSLENADDVTKAQRCFKAIITKQW